MSFTNAQAAIAGACSYLWLHISMETPAPCAQPCTSLSRCVARRYLVCGCFNCASTDTHQGATQIVMYSKTRRQTHQPSPVPQLAHKVHLLRKKLCVVGAAVQLLFESLHRHLHTAGRARRLVPRQTVGSGQRQQSSNNTSGLCGLCAALTRTASPLQSRLCELLDS